MVLIDCEMEFYRMSVRRLAVPAVLLYKSLNSDSLSPACLRIDLKVPAGMSLGAWLPTSAVNRGGEVECGNLNYAFPAIPLVSASIAPQMICKASGISTCAK